jgi:hypothetical protein
MVRGIAARGRQALLDGDQRGLQDIVTHPSVRSASGCLEVAGKINHRPTEFEASEYGSVGSTP